MNFNVSIRQVVKVNINIMSEETFFSFFSLTGYLCTMNQEENGCISTAFKIHPGTGDSRTTTPQEATDVMHAVKNPNDFLEINLKIASIY